jgi:hypothetical protein
MRAFSVAFILATACSFTVRHMSVVVSTVQLFTSALPVGLLVALDPWWASGGFDLTFGLATGSIASHVARLCARPASSHGAVADDTINCDDANCGS